MDLTFIDLVPGKILVKFWRVLILLKSHSCEQKGTIDALQLWFKTEVKKLDFGWNVKIACFKIILKIH